jgi:hypothetical protein
LEGSCRAQGQPHAITYAHDKPCGDSEWHRSRVSEEVEKCPGQEKAQTESVFDRLVRSESTLKKA